MKTSGLFPIRPRSADLVRSGLGAAICCSIAVCFCSCSPKADSDRDEMDATPKRVYVVNYPLYFFAQQIGGDQLEVNFPVPENVDPAFWEPGDDQLSRYQNAALVVLNGAGYAKWTESVSLPPSRTLNSSAAFKAKWLVAGDDYVHRHGPEGEEHRHAGTAFTTWLDPALASQQVEAMATRFERLWPEHKTQFEDRASELRSQLQQLGQQLDEANAKYRGQPLLASHPVYQYLAARLEWDLRSMHWEPDATPTDEQWDALDLLLETQPAKLMIWEGTPTAETLDELGARGIKVVVFETCGNRPSQGRDYFAAMKANIDALQVAIEELPVTNP